MYFNYYIIPDYEIIIEIEDVIFIWKIKKKKKEEGEKDLQETIIIKINSDRD